MTSSVTISDLNSRVTAQVNVSNILGVTVPTQVDLALGDISALTGIYGNADKTTVAAALSRAGTLITNLQNAGNAIGDSVITEVAATVTQAIGNTALTGFALDATTGAISITSAIGSNSIANVSTTIVGAIGNQAISNVGSSLSAAIGNTTPFGASQSLSAALGGSAMLDGYTTVLSAMGDGALLEGGRSVSGAIGTIGTGLLNVAGKTIANAIGNVSPLGVDQSLSTALGNGALLEGSRSVSHAIGTIDTGLLNVAGKTIANAIGNVSPLGVDQSLSTALGNGALLEGSRSVSHAIGTIDTGLLNVAGKTIANAIGNVSPLGVDQSLSTAIGTLAIDGEEGPYGLLNRTNKTIADAIGVVSPLGVDQSLSAAIGANSIANVGASISAAIGNQDIFASSLSEAIGAGDFSNFTTQTITGVIGNADIKYDSLSVAIGTIGPVATGFTERSLSGAVGTKSIKTTEVGSVGLLATPGEGAADLDSELLVNSYEVSLSYVAAGMLYCFHQASARFEGSDCHPIYVCTKYSGGTCLSQVQACTYGDVSDRRCENTATICTNDGCTTTATICTSMRDPYRSEFPVRTDACLNTSSCSTAVVVPISANAVGNYQALIECMEEQLIGEQPNVTV